MNKILVLVVFIFGLLMTVGSAKAECEAYCSYENPIGPGCMTWTFDYGPCTSDGNDCTLDVCNGAGLTCTHTPLQTGASCAGGTGTCQLNIMQQIFCLTPGYCTDFNACTTDSWNGICSHTPITCPAMPLNTVSCNPATGCVYTPISCNDNNACTINDYEVQFMGCQGTPITCDDNNAGTADTCAPATGCVYTPMCVPSTELCNGLDDDCDTLIDEGVKVTYYHDGDSDTFGDPADTTQACTTPLGYVSNNDDCDDASDSIHPGATDIPGDSIDQNCDGFDAVEIIDTDGDTIPDATDTDDDNDGVSDGPDLSDLDPTYCIDSDSDTCNDCSQNPTGIFTPTPWPLYVPSTATDGPDSDGDGICDSGDTVDEVCNGDDDDGDGETDEDLTGALCPLQNGVCAGSTQVCTGSGGWICNYGAFSTDYEFEESTCDDLDNDCDGGVDEGCSASYCINEGFEGSFLPIGWSVFKPVGLDGTLFTQSTTAPYVGSYSAYAPGAISQNAFLTLPGITVADGTKLKFWARIANNAGGYAYLAVHYSKSPLSSTNTGNMITMYSDDILYPVLLSTVWTEYEIDLSAYAGQTTYLGLYHSGGKDIYIDSVTVEECTIVSADEECNGQDDDLDGSIDEGLTGPLCSLQSGVCLGSRQTCDGANGWQACTVGTYNTHNVNYEILEITCDDLDNDCDTQVDEGDVCVTPPICGDGIVAPSEGCDDGDTSDGDGCSSVCAIENGWTCVGVPSICELDCVPLLEVYDLKDNDCDGLIDELQPNPDDYYTKTELSSTWPIYGASLIGFSGTWVDSTVTDALEWLYLKTVDLQNQIDNIELIAGPPGPVGPQGPQGVQGVNGLPGADGPQGEPGDQGLTGQDGDNGFNCWDLNMNYMDDSEEDINEDKLFNVLDCQGAKGDKGDTGTQGIPGVNGVDGKDGLPGEKGDKGDTGETGPAGAGGLNGEDGKAGLNGLHCWDLNLNGLPDIDEDITDDGIVNVYDCQGIKGDKGDKGDQGIQGVNGLPGKDGLNGVDGKDGLPGDKGDKGDQGIQGEQGLPGEKGDTGDVGPKGDTGEVGPQGMLGDKGDKGDKGDQGIQGIQGNQGNQGFSVVSEVTDAGAECVNGGDKISFYRDTNNDGIYQESTDVPLLSVAYSCKGDEGIQGIQGDKGDKGDQGIQGVNGLPGKDGLNGVDGKDGLPGDKGDTGADGVQGPQGEQGIQGIPGIDGLNGTDGATGPQGETGPQGIQGEIGPQGEQGESGTADFTMNYYSCDNYNSGSTKTCNMGKHMFCYLSGQKNKEVNNNNAYHLCDINGNLNGNWEVKAVRAWCEVRCINE